MTKRTPPIQPEAPSVLASLRQLAPERSMQLFEALRVAELQASRLLELSGVDLTPVPSEIISRLPRMSIEYDFDMPDSASGASAWDSQTKTWIVTLNGRHVDTRQRFTLLHEYKHIVDHGRLPLAVETDRHHFGLPPVEYVADYFAGCVLVPKRLLKRAWGQGIQSVVTLAVLFDVSQRAMEVRLTQVGLIRRADRCDEQSRPPKSDRRSRWTREGNIGGACA